MPSLRPAPYCQKTGQPIEFFSASCDDALFAHPALANLRNLVETYLQRRFDLDPLVREEMADQVASRITSKTGLRRDSSQTVEEFLEAVTRQIRDTARFR